MEDWNIHDLSQSGQILKYNNGTVSLKNYELTKANVTTNETTKVYLMITSGMDGSYIADNFVARHELADFWAWPYTYVTIALALNATDVNNGTEIPDENFEDHKRMIRYAESLVAQWEIVIDEYYADMDKGEKNKTENSFSPLDCIEFYRLDLH